MEGCNVILRVLYIVYLIRFILKILEIYDYNAKTMLATSFKFSGFFQFVKTSTLVNALSFNG